MTITNTIPIHVTKPGRDYEVELHGTAAGSKVHSACSYKPPWTRPVEMSALYVAMESMKGASVNVDPGVLKAGQKMNVFTSSGTVAPDHIWQVGRKLYDRLFSTSLMHSTFSGSLSSKDKNVILLHLPRNDSRLHAYPWELLHDSAAFLFLNRHTQIIRSMAASHVSGLPQKVEMGNLLILSPRPQYPHLQAQAELGLAEPVMIREIFRDSEKVINVHFLPGAAEAPSSGARDSTLTLLNRFFHPLIGKEQSQSFILHIDTHGSFGWLCSSCNIVNPPGRKVCAGCSCPRTGAHKEQGYLAFEDANGVVEWVGGERLGSLLSDCPVQVVVLSACKSGLSGGSSALTSVAGMLVYQGVPAVVAMQYSIRINQAYAFVEGLYTAIRNGRTIVDAVAEGRISMNASSEDHWYRPVLYLRDDPENPVGDLFIPRTMFDREAAITAIEEIYKSLLPNDPRGRIYNLFGPEGLGKTSLLQEIQIRWATTYPVVYLPLRLFLSRRLEDAVEGEHTGILLDKILRRLIFEIAPQAGANEAEMVAEAEKLKDNPAGQSRLLENLAAIAENNGRRVIVLLDDYDRLAEVDRRLFSRRILQPLLSHTLIVMASEVDRVTEFRNDGVYNSGQAYQMMSQTFEQVLSSLPDLLKPLAAEIYAETGGLPALLEKMITELKTTPDLTRAKFLKTQSERIRRHQLSQPVHRIIWGPDERSEKIVTVMTVPRRIDSGLLQELLPLVIPKNDLGFTNNWFAELIDQMGSKVDWAWDGRGYILHPCIRLPAALFLRTQRQTRSLYRTLHQAARDIFKKRLRASRQFQPAFLQEMLYHQLELLRLSRKSGEAIREALSRELLDYIDGWLDDNGRAAARKDPMTARLEKDPELAPYRLAETFNAAMY